MNKCTDPPKGIPKQKTTNDTENESKNGEELAEKLNKVFSDLRATESYMVEAVNEKIEDTSTSMWRGLRESFCTPKPLRALKEKEKAMNDRLSASLKSANDVEWEDFHSCVYLWLKHLLVVRELRAAYEEKRNVAKCSKLYRYLVNHFRIQGLGENYKLPEQTHRQDKDWASFNFKLQTLNPKNCNGKKILKKLPRSALKGLYKLARGFFLKGTTVIVEQCPSATASKKKDLSTPCSDNIGKSSVPASLFKHVAHVARWLAASDKKPEGVFVVSASPLLRSLAGHSYPKVINQQKDKGKNTLKTPRPNNKKRRKLKKASIPYRERFRNKQ